MIMGPQTVLIMDEVDGMSAGDRGGVADLIQTIHKSKIPIVAICNDKYNQKLKSLRNHCMELEYRCLARPCTGGDSNSVLPVVPKAHFGPRKPSNQILGPSNHQLRDYYRGSRINSHQVKHLVRQAQRCGPPSFLHHAREISPLNGA